MLGSLSVIPNLYGNNNNLICAGVSRQKTRRVFQYRTGSRNPDMPSFLLVIYNYG